MNWTVVDTQIARIADKLPASSIYMFSYTNLELTDIQISNASGEIQVTNAEIRVKMLERWKSQKENTTVHDLLSKLIAAEVDPNIYKFLREQPENDPLTPGMLYQVARYFEHGSFVQFSNGHLNVSSSEIEAFLTMNSNSRIKQAMGVLRMWRNTKYPNSKLEQLFQKIEEGIEDGLLSSATRQMFIQLIECRAIIQGNNDIRNARTDIGRKTIENFPALKKELNIGIASHLREAEIMSLVQLERLQNFPADDHKRILILGVIMCLDTPEQLEVLKRALHDCNQADLAQLYD